MKLQKSILAIFTLFICALTASAQFGELINKAKNKIDKAQKKTEQTTVQTNTNNSGVSNGNSGASAARSVKLGEPGSIGLSKSPIDPKNWQAAKYESSFTANDNIYAIVFFNAPVTNLGINNSNEEMIVWFDNGSGVMTDYWGIPIKTDQKNATFITLPINPAPADVFNQADATAAKRFVDFLQKYDNAKGTMKMLAGGDQQAGTIIALDFTGGRAVAEARAGQIEKAIAANSDKANGDNPLPKAGMNNPALEKQFAALINARGYEWKLIKIIVVSPEWQIARHEISGAILNRYVVARNVVKDPTGVCRIQSTYFIQDYNGSGYGKTYLDVAMGRTDDYAVSCDKAK